MVLGPVLVLVFWLGSGLVERDLGCQVGELSDPCGGGADRGDGDVLGAQIEERLMRGRGRVRGRGRGRVRGRGRGAIKVRAGG